MLTEVCDYVHNYFECLTHYGTFQISNGNIDLTRLVKNGQRFRVIGSALNDGIYTWDASGMIYNDDGDTVVSLVDETFTGSIVAMAVPTAFLKIVKDIVDWQEKNKAVVESPYQSESFGGYSYTKASGANSGGFTWQDMFRTRLNAYRRIA